MGVGAAIIASTLVGVGSTIYSAKQQKKAVKEQKRSQRLQQRQADMRANKERRRFAAAQRVQQAQQTAAGFSSGAGTSSSALQGALGANQTNLASNIGFSNQMQGISGQISASNIKAAGYESNANFAMGMNSAFQTGISPWMGPTVGTGSTTSIFS